MSWTFEYKDYKEVLSEEQFFEWLEDNFPEVIEELGATDESWNNEIYEYLGWGFFCGLRPHLVTVYSNDYC